MKRFPGVILLVVQLLLVLSIAGKYLWERHSCPRVWVRTGQYDPEQPLRGRYLSLQPVVDACSLPHDKDHLNEYYNVPGADGHWNWRAALAVRDGKLVPVIREGLRPEEEVEVNQRKHQDCARASAGVQMEYFLPEHASTPFPLAPGEELWVEVTVPPAGPPRPIQLSLSGPEGFKPLVLR